MKKNYSYIGLTSIALAVIGVFVCKSNAQITTSDTISNMAERASIFTNASDVNKAYRSGQISRGEAVMAGMLIKNQQALGMYGKVIDQYGEPVSSAEITGSVKTFDWHAPDGEVYKEYKTQTDAQGLFQFIGLKGVSLSASVSKPGYEIDYRVGQAGPVANESTPNDRATFLMWKLRGAEPMVHVEVEAKIACDGSPTRLDLISGKKSINGDLIVKLTRNPVNIVRGKPFDWSATLEITNGGFEEITNLYPNEAPANGYQTTMTLDFPTNMVGWQSSFDHLYYFKSKDGQLYGRIAINITADFQPPPTFFGAEIYANPSGSRNLEFDPKKQIR